MAGTGGAEQMRRMIREEDPKTPSVQLSLIAGPDSQKRAQACRTNFRTLSRRLHGDLDWITIKAMDKDRMRRYGSAGELAADIRRHLNDEPVEAGPPSLAYLLKKLVRRHRTFSSVAVAVVVSLLIGFVINIYLYKGKIMNDSEINTIQEVMKDRETVKQALKILNQLRDSEQSFKDFLKRTDEIEALLKKLT